MGVNIYGSSGARGRTGDRAYVDSKFINLVQNLETKLDKKITTDLDMEGHRINRVVDPIQNTDVSNKSYVDKKIYNTVQEMEKRNGNINIETLLKVANIFKNLKLNVKYEPYFSLRHTHVQSLYTAIAIQFKGETYKRVLREFEGLAFVEELKNVVMRVILELSEDEFVNLKEILQKNKLLAVLEERTSPYRCVKIVNVLVSKSNPESKNKDVELLTQKNLTLIQLGYIFIHEGLL
jgi:hypothetical protein